MISFNSLDYSNIQSYHQHISNTLQPNKFLGGLWSEQNEQFSTTLEPIIGKNILFNSGTNALLSVLEWLESKHRVYYYVSEFSYFFIWGFLQNRTYEMISSRNDEVTPVPLPRNLDITPENGWLPVYILTSHNNINVTHPKDEHAFYIEDRCQVFGTSSKLKPDVAIYSFSNNKILQGGEGGCLATDNKELLSWVTYRQFSDVKPTKKQPYFFTFGNYQHGNSTMPFKGSMSALVSSFLHAQLLDLPRLQEIRQKNYKKLSVLKFDDRQKSEAEFPLGYPLFYQLELHRQTFAIQNKFIKHGIQTYIGLLPYNHYKKQPMMKYCIQLPVHPNLSDNDISHIVNVTKEIYGKLK